MVVQSLVKVISRAYELAFTKLCWYAVAEKGRCKKNKFFPFFVI